MNKRNAILFLLSLLLFSFAIKDEGTQHANYECTDPLVQDKKLFNIEEGKVYFSFDKALRPKNLKSQGFHWVEDKPKGYFTAYLVNNSDSTFKTSQQDGSLIMIQEAMDEQGQWVPIEHWVRSGCGNSYHQLTLEPGHYVMIPIKEYKGSYHTKIRLKMRRRRGSNIFYSEPFKGSIDPSQFRKETKQVDGILYSGPADYLDD